MTSPRFEPTQRGLYMPQPAFDLIAQAGRLGALKHRFKPTVRTGRTTRLQSAKSHRTFHSTFGAGQPEFYVSYIHGGSSNA